MTDIQKSTVRTSLPARNEPHWRNLGLGKSIGYRKTTSGAESWVARYRLDGVKEQKAIGRLDQFGYEQAVKEAGLFFAAVEAGISTGNETVEEACKAYVENRRLEKGERTATDAEKRFNGKVYGTDFGRKKLDKLRPKDVEDWRNTTAISATKSTANRDLRSLKAALNYAYRQDMTNSDRAWRIVGMFPNADGRRELYLPREERAAFLAVCAPRLRALVTAIIYTGARPGEVRALKVRDLDLNTQTLTFRTRKGNGGGERVRTFPLTGPVLEFFKGLGKGKLPAAPLLEFQPAMHWPEHQVNLQVKKARRAHGFDDTLVAYTFRHCTISDWLADGVPVADVAHLCGTSIEKISSNYYKFIQSKVEERLAAITLL